MWTPSSGLGYKDLLNSPTSKEQFFLQYKFDYLFDFIGNHEKKKWFYDNQGQWCYSQDVSKTGYKGKGLQNDEQF